MEGAGPTTFVYRASDEGRSYLYYLLQFTEAVSTPVAVSASGADSVVAPLVANVPDIDATPELGAGQSFFPLARGAKMKNEHFDEAKEQADSTTVATTAAAESSPAAAPSTPSLPLAPADAAVELCVWGLEAAPPALLEVLGAAVEEALYDYAATRLGSHLRKSKVSETNSRFKDVSDQRLLSFSRRR